MIPSTTRTSTVAGALILLLASLLPSACADTNKEGGTDVPAARPNYYEDVRPILSAHCLDCHFTTDSITEMVKLVPYERARDAAPLISHVIREKTMPLWGMDNSSRCNTWQNPRWLDPKDAETLLRWVELGAPEGDPARAGAAVSTRRVAQTLRHADATLDPGAAYAPQPGAGVVRCFVVDPMLTSSRLLTALEVAPARTWSVQQVSLYSLETPEAEAAAATLDAADPVPGYECLSDAKVAGAKLVVGSSWIDATTTSWVTRLPEGLGVRLPAARKMIMQVHYNLISGMDPDRSLVRLELQDAAREACWLPLGLDYIALEPGLALTSARGFATVPRDVEVHAAYPLMQFLGRSMSVAADGACLGEMYHWDQHGLQHLYAYERPPTLRTAERVRFTCSYTTLGRDRPVARGTGVDDEQCGLRLLVTPCP